MRSLRTPARSRHCCGRAAAAASEFCRRESSIVRPAPVMSAGVQNTFGSTSTRADFNPGTAERSCSAAQTICGPIVQLGDVSAILTVRFPSSSMSQSRTNPMSRMLTGACAAMLQGSQIWCSARRIALSIELFTRPSFHSRCPVASPNSSNSSRVAAGPYAPALARTRRQRCASSPSRLRDRRSARSFRRG